MAAALRLLSRSIPRLAAPPSSRFASVMAAAATNSPIEDAIRSKLTVALAPRTLEIYNDSHKHAHHAAMRGVSDKKETHFRYGAPPLLRGQRC